MISKLYAAGLRSFSRHTIIRITLIIFIVTILNLSSNLVLHTKRDIAESEYSTGNAEEILSQDFLRRGNAPRNYPQCYDVEKVFGNILLIARTPVQNQTLRYYLREKRIRLKDVCNTKILFLFGTFPTSPESQKVVDDERVKYEDIIQFQFIEDQLLESQNIPSLVTPWTAECTKHVADVVFIEFVVTDWNRFRYMGNI